MKTKNTLLLFVSSVLIYVFISAIPIKSVLYFFDLSPMIAQNIGEFLKNITIIIFAIIAIKKLKILALSGLTNKLKWSHKYLVFIPAYIIVIGGLKLVYLEGGTISITDLIIILLTTMSIGFSEEFVFRGLLIPILIEKYYNKKSGIFLSIFIPAIVFALLHLFNFKVENLSSEVAQLLYATYFGVFFGAVLFRTNRIIPIAIMHGLIDFVSALKKVAVQTEPIINSTSKVVNTDINITSEIIKGLTSSVIILPLFIIGLLIIRKITKESIAKKIETSNT